MTVDFIMIVGKYFKSPNDFINIMKICKRYEELVLMYKFNPISDISLFENIQTQHFYNKEDVKNKKDGLFQYIYWFNDEELIKNKKDNEIFFTVNGELIEKKFILFGEELCHAIRFKNYKDKTISFNFGDKEPFKYDIVSYLQTYLKQMNEIKEKYNASKEKWQITIDFIMIVGKYLKSDNDFINTMKVCKRYKELVLMYKFNPISDISLF